ncbi:MAG: hypothetical protein DIZ80_09370 [endosymbiont of Galathealinum brachiosum]|uniref:Double Cache domain-containing protein n=1 Tax=endosymbiont of Galathealinum brachiosum TaxID=2200906 RepID=A0A370DDV7_9GAMM|nr:MAG: hypothetical protein DIZ80_09370 [endosymbiont of Galathealinum brachiosum]
MIQYLKQLRNNHYIKYLEYNYMSYAGIKITSLSLFIVFSLFMTLIFRSYIIEKQSNGINANISNINFHIRKSVDFLINNKKQEYISISKIIFSDKSILEALKNKERDNFYKAVTTKYYSRAKKRDKDFWGLHIILPNNLSFIRVHKPHVADELISEGAKPLIDKVNKSHQLVTGFDAGKFGYFLRVVTPIHSLENNYLGAAEFSISINSLTQYIKTDFGHESLFLIKNIKNKAFLYNLPRTDDGLIHFKSTDSKLFSQYRTDDHSLIQYNNKSYSAISIELSKTAKLIVAIDITKIINEKNIFENNINALIAIVIAIFSMIWFFATRFYINNRRHTEIQLQNALDTIKTLEEIIPICSYCHKIRDDEGAWDRIESYISDHSEAKFSHGICPDCFKEEKEKLNNM